MTIRVEKPGTTHNIDESGKYEEKFTGGQNVSVRAYKTGKGGELSYRTDTITVIKQKIAAGETHQIEVFDGESMVKVNIVGT